MDRRQFTKGALLASAGLASLPARSVNSMMLTDNARLKKGVMWGSIRKGRTAAEKFHHTKQAGLEGIEVKNSPATRLLTGTSTYKLTI